jgi:lipoate-protein ligase B
VSQAPAADGSAANSQTEPDGFKVWRPGRVRYRDAQAFQADLVDRRRDWNHDLLILLEHPPVITFGRKTEQDNLLWDQKTLQAAGIDCVPSQRGGDITLHGPGQLVGYPIVDLNHYCRDLHRYLRQLEEILILTLADFGLAGEALSGKTGVWVEGRKIASIGIAVRRWISYHGFAMNVDNDLSVFDAIIPCGLPGVTMTSIRRELGEPVAGDQVAEALIGHFGAVMQRPLLGDFDDISTPAQA